MKILEIKNNLVKISYTAADSLVISGFVIIEDNQCAYVAQIMSLKADSGINYAIVKLLFTFNEQGIVKNYNGSIPEMSANITTLTPEELLDILPIETPLTIGKLAQQSFILNVDFSTLDKNLLICSDNLENTDIVLSNIAKQITSNNNKSVIFDTSGTINAENRLIFGLDFKLPLNYDTINYIYEHDLNDVSPTSKAIIQDILLEVQEYSRTVLDNFVPFDSLLRVVDMQYKNLQLPELALLKSRLIKYKDQNAFAQDANEFQSVRASLRANLSTLFDISSADSSLQNLIISTVYNEIDALDLYVYSLVKIDNDNSDKKLIKNFLHQNKISTIVACAHNYKYVHELKEVAGNIIMFAPLTVQHDFGAYNVFLNKLNQDECVIYGKSTQYIPLIIEMMTLEELQDYIENIKNVPTENTRDLNNAFVENSDSYSQESLMNDNPPVEQITLNSSDGIIEEPQTEDDLAVANDTFNEIEENADYSAEQAETKEIVDNTLNDMDELVEQQSAETHDFIGEEMTETPLEEEYIPEGEEMVETPLEEEYIPEDEEMVEAPLEEEYVPASEEKSETAINNEVISDNETEPELAQDVVDSESLDNLSDNINYNQEQDIITEEDLDYIDNSANTDEYTEYQEEPANMEDDIIPDASEFGEAVYNEEELNYSEQADVQESENQAINESNVESYATDSEEYLTEEQAFSDDSTDNDEQPPVVPIYPAEETPVSGPVEIYESGDRVTHPKYGEGVVEKMVKFGNKVLCAINFANGRRLLDPTISQISKI